MILVTLGTHPQPMNRLMIALDALVGHGTVQDDVLVQTPVLGYRPEHLRTTTVMPYQQLVKHITEADVVVSHAGPGTLGTIRLLGKVPLVVPRSARAGEHVDDHQERYARYLEGRDGYVVVRNISDLADAIGRVQRMGRVDVRPPDVTRAVRALEEMLLRSQENDRL